MLEFVNNELLLSMLEYLKGALAKNLILFLLKQLGVYLNIFLLIYFSIFPPFASCQVEGYRDCHLGLSLLCLQGQLTFLLGTHI